MKTDSSFPVPPPTLAETELAGLWSPPLLAAEAGLAVGAILTLLGMFLHWRLTHYRMSAEERIKDGELSEADAARRIRLQAYSAPIFTILGALALVDALMRYGP